MDRPTHAYLGVKSCGCFAFIGGDEPQLATDLAKDTAWVIRNGGKVERLPTDEAKARLQDLPFGCETCEPKGKKKAAAAQQSFSLEPSHAG